MSDDFSKTLVDVRKAYRLVYLYQKNILATIEKFVEDFDANFFWWSPSSYDPPPKRSTNPFDRWTWDMNPLYNTAFFFKPDREGTDTLKPGDWLLVVHLLTDEEIDDESHKGEPNPVEFNSAAAGRSFLTASLWYCSKSVKGDWYWDIWEKLEYPEEADDGYKEFGEPEGLKCVALDISIESVFDEEAIVNSSKKFQQLVKDKIPGFNW